MPDRPNILWICTDSQRFDTLGCYGNPHVRSPNIDRLAEEGTLFENCFAQNPLCTPSRGAFLTGRYPVTNKLRQNGQCIPEGEVLVTRILADHEYICGLSGKLHLSAANRRFLMGDKWWELPHEERLVQGVERRIDDGYQEFWWDHAPNPEFRSSAYTRWLQEKGVQLQRADREDSRFVKSGMPSEHHQTTFCAEKAIGFIEAYEGYRHPWLFSVNIFDPHFGFDPPEGFLEPYLDPLDEIPLPNYVEGELRDKPHYQMDRHQPRKHTPRYGGYSEERDAGDPHEHRMLRAAYWAMCDHIDVQVGRMLEALERTGQRKNTLVIFTSDHGEMLGDHGLYTKGPFLYDPAVQVPLIVSWPGHVESGVRSPALIELADLAPTVLEAAGLERHPAMQTRSLWPLLTGEEPADHFRDDIYCEYYNSNPHASPVFLTMVRTQDHKLVVCHGEGTGELYDLERDPTETHNLWDEPDYAGVKTDMLVRMTDRMAWTADPLPPRIGIY
ncbi:MAG: sulfatase-like hydrolase/transferase [Candidatus Brocadiia bacterium]